MQAHTDRLRLNTTHNLPTFFYPKHSVYFSLAFIVVSLITNSSNLCLTLLFISSVPQTGTFRDPTHRVLGAVTLSFTPTFWCITGISLQRWWFLAPSLHPPCCLLRYTGKEEVLFSPPTTAKHTVLRSPPCVALTSTAASAML